MISVTITRHGRREGLLNIVTGRPGQYMATLNDFDADDSPGSCPGDHVICVEFNSRPDDWPEHEIIRPSDTMKLVAKAMQQLFSFDSRSSVVAKTGRETAMEAIKDGDPVEDIALAYRPNLSPGQFFEFEDTHRGRKKAIFDLMQKVAKLEKEMKDLKLSVWLADKRLIILEHQRFKELDRKMEELDKREKELEIKESKCHVK